MSLEESWRVIENFFTHPNSEWASFRMVIVFGVALVGIYFFNRLLESLTPKIADKVTTHTDSLATDENYVRLRRMETFMSISVTVLRVLVVFTVLYFAWRFTSPGGIPIALVGASTVFIILASATLVPLLRDITYGFIMIAEQWYNVGDHVVLEPFSQSGGVVERVTLRATKIRSVNGESIWVHHQHIQAVRVTSAAAHTLAVETFVNNPERGKRVLKDAIQVIPSSPITTPQPLAISEVKQIRENLWRITAICEVTPYREWLIEDYAAKVIKETDELNGKDKCIVHGPVVYYADTTAEKRYRRTIRTRRRTEAK